VNVFLLWQVAASKHYKTGEWASYRQWQERGAQVRKGERGTMIVFWKKIDVDPDEDNEQQKTRMFAKYSAVFNADQVEGYEITIPEKSDISVIARADNLLEASGADIRHGPGGAYYAVIGDYINLPCPEDFKATDASTATQNYYSIALHELTHWSGSANRLDRFAGWKAGTETEAFEELIAELGSVMLCAMLCAMCGVESTVRADHAHYIAHWLKALKNDRKCIFRAASAAQKAADYLVSFLEEKTEGEAA
jgi:antirestriction protein ArdC